MKRENETVVDKTREGSNATAENNKILMQRAVEEVWNQGNYDILNEIIADDFVIYSGTNDTIHGSEGVKKFYGELRRAFPNIHFTIKKMIAEGDRVVTHWSARAKHTGEYLGISPTGREFNFSGIDIDRFADNKVIECWSHMDELGLMKQLGVFNAEQSTNKQVRDAWDNVARGYDEFVTPTYISLSDQVLNKAGLRSGMKFLDVASGSGSMSIAAARLGANVLSTDISPVMIELLEKRANKEGLNNLNGRVMDGHSLELEDNTFDISGSEFGVMLFPDMPKGISELVRVTKPGGRVLMVVLGSPVKVEFFFYFISALKEVIPGFNPPLDPAPLPFQLQDPDILYSEMTKAGLKNVRVETLIHKQKFISGEYMYNWLISSNPVAVELVSDLTEAQKDAIRLTLDKMLHARPKNDSMLNCPVNIGIGTK